MRALAPPADGEVGHRPAPGTAGPAASLGYQPALDGIRAVSLAGVLLFHHGYRGAPGGFLGVSTFFTLSGFLITTLAITEWAGTGRLSPARFYERRARRLLPAALLTFAGVVALRALTPVGSGQAFRGDVLAALGYAANWRFAATGDDYAALFAQPSPVLHFWSLAIEEQFYLAFPLLFVAVMALVTRLAGRPHPSPSTTDTTDTTDTADDDGDGDGDGDGNGDGRARGERDGVLLGGGLVFGVLTGVSFGAAWVLASRNGNDGVTYYGTHTRAGELLVGVTLAFLIRLAWSRRRLASRATGWALAVAGPAALVALAVLWHRATLDGPRLFHGVTVANAGLSAVVIVAALHAAPPFRGGLGVLPLRALGKVSYAAYLFHWPVFLWLAAPRVDLDTRPLFALRVGVTLGLATVSYHLLESPFRFRLKMPRPRLAAGLAGGAAVVAALVVVVPQQATDRIDFSAVGAPGPAEPPADGAPGTPPPVGANPSTGPGDAEGNPDVEPQFPFLRQEGLIRPNGGAPPAARILLVGDSLASSLVAGLEDWNDDHPDQQIWVDTHTVFGCPLVDTGVTPIIDTWPTTAQCVDWHQDLDNALVRYDTDVVLFTMGLADLQGHQVDGQMLDIGNAVHDDWFAAELDRLATTLTEPGLPLLWTNFPHVRMESLNEPTKDWRDFRLNEPHRVDRLNELLAGVATRHPGVTPVDLDGWVHGWDGGEFDPALRDGVHFLDEGADRTAGWLVPQLLAAAGA